MASMVSYYVIKLFTIFLIKTYKRLCCNTRANDFRFYNKTFFPSHDPIDFLNRRK